MCTCLSEHDSKRCSQFLPIVRRHCLLRTFPQVQFIPHDYYHYVGRGVLANTLNPLLDVLETLVFGEIVYHQCPQGLPVVAVCGRGYAAVMERYCYCPAASEQSYPCPRSAPLSCGRPAVAPSSMKTPPPQWERCSWSGRYPI